MWHTGTGIIKYDPLRPGLKKKKDWWAIVRVDPEITRYYRWWVKNRYWIDLCKPSWDAHISIVRGEKPEDRLAHLWKKYDGHKVTFKYSHEVYQADKGEFWMVDVDCPFLLDIRRELNRPANWNLHLTIGRTW